MLSHDKQMHINISYGDVGRYVILTGDPDRCEAIAQNFDNAEFISQKREYVIYTGFLNGEKVSVCSTGIGGPSTAIAIEELIKCGADTFIRVGTCGGIAEQVMGGDVIIANSAIRQEGTTYEYMPEGYPATASFDVTLALYNASLELGYTSHVGVVQSKDNFYGQHDPDSMPVGSELNYKWNAYKKAGVVGSEMECSTVFVVSAVRGSRSGAVLNVLWNQERKKSGLSNPIDLSSEKGINTAVRAMQLLIEQDKQ